MLTAFELSGLDLRGTKLAVLSACETGMGNVEAGNGVGGLRKALALAGAASQVMSLLTHRNFLLTCSGDETGFSFGSGSVFF